MTLIYPLRYLLTLPPHISFIIPLYSHPLFFLSVALSFFLSFALSFLLWPVSQHWLPASATCCCHVNNKFMYVRHSSHTHTQHVDSIYLSQQLLSPNYNEYVLQWRCIDSPNARKGAPWFPEGLKEIAGQVGCGNRNGGESTRVGAFLHLFDGRECCYGRNRAIRCIGLRRKWWCDVNKLLRIDWLKHVTRFNDVITEGRGDASPQRGRSVAPRGEIQA